ncbi:uncharacterized protein LOC116196077 [Punica granatum]|uniref:Uncharacterized protein LOC116196077 n=1 Tax=Punica granatum TaxID=22663 RepID=A0A6P8CEL4_PUNGR|nr:uncharacterized protein LOC116196077 [Punica granatum]XP_031381466.1 uncharacterized protein LOC116196077 [Punica granatum]
MSDGTAASALRPAELPESSPTVDGTHRFGDLRSVQWRIGLGVLPSSPSASTDELRRVTADSRRRYAGLRRRLLIDPHTSKDGSNSPNLAVDNPLSQNPESRWGRFFRNAELEKMVDQDLLRLYPEDGSYFQTPGCQGMLRRILLLWCLRHPNYGYRQGMHELLAPLIYVLQVDINRLSQVRKLYEDYFTDKFDELSVHESDFTYNFDYKRFSNAMESSASSHGNIVKARSLDDLDPDVQKIVLLSDPYGAEGELGIVLSEKFMEHDAYSMFEALMSGVNGSIAMADFFSHLPADGNNNSSPPVIEASAALYHLLSVVDLPLHTHLTELGVEPQYFCLRWLRVLFGREFALLDLLVIWDEIFAQDNGKIDSQSADSFAIFGSARGAFIAAMAVSMILYLRPSLLGAELATSALQRLLNFPQNVDLKKLIQRAKSLQVLALDASRSLLMAPLMVGAFNQTKPIMRGHSLSSDSISPKSPLSLVPDSYWEERWRIWHKEEEKIEQSNSEKRVSIPTKKKGWTEKVRASLTRTESDPSAKAKNVRKVPTAPVRRSLLEDLSRQLGSDEGIQDIIPGDGKYSSEDTASEEDSSVSSNPSSPLSGSFNSAKSNAPPAEHEDCRQSTVGDSSLPVSDVPEESSRAMASNKDSVDKLEKDAKEQKPLFGKFQWLWKFGRGHASEETSDRVGDPIEAPKSTDPEGNQNIETKSSVSDGNHEPSVSSSTGDAPDLKVMGTFKNLGQSMLEHIQVIESAFQQDRGQVGSLESFSKNVLVGKGQVTAMAALKELRKISNLLSEM